MEAGSGFCLSFWKNLSSRTDLAHVFSKSRCSVEGDPLPAEVGQTSYGPLLPSLGSYWACRAPISEAGQAKRQAQHSAAWNLPRTPPALPGAHWGQSWASSPACALSRRQKLRRSPLAAKMLLLLLGIIVLHVAVLVLLFVSTIVSVSAPWAGWRGRDLGHPVLTQS